MVERNVNKKVGEDVDEDEVAGSEEVDVLGEERRATASVFCLRRHLQQENV